MLCLFQPETWKLPDFDEKQVYSIYVVVVRAALANAATAEERKRWIKDDDCRAYHISCRSIIKFGVAARPSSRFYAMQPQSGMTGRKFSAPAHGMAVIKRVKWSDVTDFGWPGVNSTYKLALVYEWALEALRLSFPLTSWTKQPIAGCGSELNALFRDAAPRNPQLKAEMEAAIEKALVAPIFVEPTRAAQA